MPNNILAANPFNPSIYLGQSVGSFKAPDPGQLDLRGVFTSANVKAVYKPLPDGAYQAYIPGSNYSTLETVKLGEGLLIAAKQNFTCSLVAPTSDTNVESALQKFLTAQTATIANPTAAEVIYRANFNGTSGLRLAQYVPENGIPGIIRTRKIVEFLDGNGNLSATSLNYTRTSINIPVSNFKFRAKFVQVAGSFIFTLRETADQQNNVKIELNGTVYYVGTRNSGTETAFVNYAGFPNGLSMNNPSEIEIELTGNTLNLSSMVSGVMTQFYTITDSKIATGGLGGYWQCQLGFAIDTIEITALPGTTFSPAPTPIPTPAPAPSPAPSSTAFVTDGIYEWRFVPGTTDGEIQGREKTESTWTTQLYWKASEMFIVGQTLYLQTFGTTSKFSAPTSSYSNIYGAFASEAGYGTAKAQATTVLTFP